VAAREADRPLGAWVGLALAALALLPPAVTGHAASAGDHDLATSSLVIHVVCVAVWVGGLIALVWYSRVDGRFLDVAVRRFSSVALWAYIGVGVSGVVNAVVRIDSVGDLWSTGYGHLVLMKTAAFLALGVFGWWHRRHSIPDLARQRPHTFARFSAVEAGIMVGTIALGVALSQTPPPETGRTAAPSAAEILLGFPLPDAPTVNAILFDWRPDLIVMLVLAVAAVGYGRGVMAMHRRGDRWPLGRTLAWYTGLAFLAVGTMSGLASYGRVVFSLHMTQHMLLSMVAPIFLVLAAPITLALRSLPVAGRNQPSGPREWLTTALQSPFVRFLTHPITALALFISAPYLIYFSGLFEVAMRQHWAHELMHVHFVLVGYLFYESLIGIDPLPYRAGYPLRLVALFSTLAFHAFFAVALMSSETLVAPSYYAALDRPWWTDLLSDQNTGSAFAWAFGEFPALIALVVLLFQWSRHDDREARRQDRQSDRDGDAELVAYNAMLQQRRRGVR
jgi:putative copper resistance protein D